MSMPRALHKVIVLVIIFGGYCGVKSAEAKLMAYWSFDEGLRDEVNGARAKVVGKVESVPGYIGSALELNGDSAHIELPVGPMLESLTDCTIAMWVNPFNNNGYYARVFDFGNDTTTSMYLAIRSRHLDSIYMQITKSGYHRGFQELEPLCKLSPGWHHIAVVLDSRSHKLSIYADGSFLGENYVSLTPKSLGKIRNAWLGRSQNRADPYFRGAYDELAIFNHSLTHKEILALYRSSAEAFRRNGDTPAERSIREAEGLMEQGKPKQAGSYILKAITQHEQLARERGKERDRCLSAVLAEMYFLLGKTRENSQSPSDSISEPFAKAAMLAPKGEIYIKALSRIFKYSGAHAFERAAQDSIQGGPVTHYHLPMMVSEFKTDADWQVFSAYLDVLLTEVDNRHVSLSSIAESLSNTAWSDRFEQYCDNAANRIPCNYELANEVAERFQHSDDFDRATQIYIKLSEQHRDAKEKARYRLKASQSLFLNGQYVEAESLLDEMLEGGAGASMNELYLLKGRLFIAGRQFSDAIATLDKVPDTSGDKGGYTQALYLKGYCKFLQNDHPSAKSALVHLQRQYPSCTYAKKASILISRIDNI